HRYLVCPLFQILAELLKADQRPVPAQVARSGKGNNLTFASSTFIRLNEFFSKHNPIYRDVRLKNDNAISHFSEFRLNSSDALRIAIYNSGRVSWTSTFAIRGAPRSGFPAAVAWLCSFGLILTCAHENELNRNREWHICSNLGKNSGTVVEGGRRCP